MTRKPSGACIFLCLGTLLLCLGLFSACAKELRRESFHLTEYFDTHTQVIVRLDSKQDLQEAFRFFDAAFAHYHDLFTIHGAPDGRGSLRDVNAGAGKAPVKVHPDLLPLLDMGVEEAKASQGRMNIAMGSVLALWSDARAEKRLPEEQALAEAAQHMNPEAIQIDKKAGTVFFKDPKLKLDAGGLAKGYAVERVAEQALAKGYHHFLISAGGNVLARGLGQEKGPWRVAIDNPLGEGVLAPIVALKDASLVTSGSRERYALIEGKRYHHIIDPVALAPVERYVSLTVLHPDSGRADALATALYNMEADAMLAYVEGQKDLECYALTAAGEVYESSGFQRFVQP